MEFLLEKNKRACPFRDLRVIKKTNAEVKMIIVKEGPNYLLNLFQIPGFSC